MMNALVRISLLMLAGLATATLTARAIPLQAEDYLYCPGASPSAEASLALNKIIAERRELAGGITLEDFPGTLTFFGVRIDEPEVLMNWRTQEDARVRALIPQGHLEQVTKFADKVRSLTGQVEQKFPIRQGFDLGMAQSVERTGDGESVRVDLSVPTNSADYRVLSESEVNEDGVLVIRVTLIRPSSYLLLDKEPVPTELKATITRKGPLPKSVELWTRTINDDLPLGLKFKRMGEAKLAGT
ncbi:MAG: hypothetical protein SFU85_07160 [Candidatus Methylacidiphilales bacterium]|nr:hypothetical protein [Candidatus Methylacidiphilales bacterium]